MWRKQIFPEFKTNMIEKSTGSHGEEAVNGELDAGTATLE